MPCYHPLKGFLAVGGGWTSSPRRGYVDVPKEVPCGQCIGCRLEKSRQWAVRIMQESSLHAFNSFVTLTYKDECLPKSLSLVHRDFQLFMKRLRKQRRNERIGYFMCGEYGEQNARPHYHAILFACDFPDRVLDRRNHRGEALYSSVILDEAWKLGKCLIGDVTFESAAYCARYVCKKVTGAAAPFFMASVSRSTRACLLIRRLVSCGMRCMVRK